MVIVYIALGLLFSVGAGAAAAFLGTGAFAAFFFYAGAGFTILMAAFVTALVTDRGAKRMPEDPMLIPGE